MFSGVEKWVNADEAAKIEQLLQTITANIFIKVAGETINTSRIEGVYTPQTLEEHLRRKNGEFPCRFGTWHPKFGKCDCEANAWQEQQFKKTDELLSQRQKVETQN